MNRRDYSHADVPHAAGALDSFDECTARFVAAVWKRQGRTLEDGSEQWAGTFASGAEWTPAELHQPMLAIAAQLAAGARRVYAVDDTGKIVWVVSQV